jgi:hypothetical protein
MTIGSAVAGGAKLPETDGIVYEGGGVRWVDTRALSWTPTAELDGSFHKILATDQDGNPSVFMEYVPPGPPAVNYRRYHKSVREFTFVIEGELPVVEYPSATSQSGALLVAKRGWCADRHPGSVYGRGPGQASIPGAVLLRVRSGSGTWEGDSNFGDESVDVSQDGAEVTGPLVSDRAGVVLDEGGIRWLDTREMEWEEYDNRESGHYRKTLIRGPHGEYALFIHFLRPHFNMIEDLPAAHYHATLGEFGYVLEGEMFNTEWQSPDEADKHHLWKPKDYFMERAIGSIHGVDVGQDAHRGCTLLQWNTGGFEGGIGNWIGDPNYEEASVTVPVT